MSVNVIEDRHTKSGTNGRRNPQRDGLRQALAALQAARDAVTRQQAAIAGMVKSKTASRRAALTAQAEIGVAIGDRAAEIAAAAASGNPAPASGVGRARARALNMADEAAAQDAALVALRGELPELHARELAAQRDVETEVCAVLAPLVTATLEKALALHRELAPLIAALSSLFVSSIGQVPTSYGTVSDVRGEALQSARRRSACFFAAPSTPLDGSPWQAFRAALIADPDAELPDIEDVRGCSR
jgi:hypothetical protein